VEARLIVSDAHAALREIPDASVDLLVTSPPYNIGKEYERDTRRTLDEYIDWLRPIAIECHRVLNKRGSLCWQVGNYVNAGQVYPLDLYFFQAFSSLGMQLRNRIIWRFNFGLHATKRFSGRYETLLWFTKSEDYKFNLDPIRIPQLYPGKRHSAAKGAARAGNPSGNPAGKNPSDYWEFSAKDAFLGDPVWDIPNVKSNHPEKTIHPCQFPHELVERCVLAFTDPTDLVLDPFLGAGTTALAAIKSGRNVIGIDRDPRYIEIAERRLDQLKRGELPLRPSGMPVRTPRMNESVSRVPEAWRENGRGGSEEEEGRPKDPDA
jgi:DNA modification methylase